MLDKLPEVRQTEAAPPTDVSPPSSLHRRAVLPLYREEEEELVLELYSRHTVDDEIRRGIHDNEQPWGVSVSRN